MKVTFFNELSNSWHFNCNVEIVAKSEIHPLYDDFVTSVGYDNGEYLNIYCVDGVLKGYFEKV